jgi:hypothetical protein
MVALATLVCICAIPHDLSSLDGFIKVSIDASTATIRSVQLGGNNTPIKVAAMGSIDKGLVLAASVETQNSSVVLSRLMCTPGMDLPCSNLQVWVNTTLTPTQDTIKLTLSVEGVNVDEKHPTPPWTIPIINTFVFEDAGGLKLWAPWDRAEKYDPLLPSDGGLSWWTGTYSFGTALAGQDFVVAEHATVIDPQQNMAVSLIGDPSNPPIPQGFFNTSGKGGATCKIPTSCAGPASLAFSYHMLRIEAGVVHRRSYDLVPHNASCFRSSLAWSVEQYPRFWKPTFPEARHVDGLGSYSSYLGNLTDPKFKEMVRICKDCLIKSSHCTLPSSHCTLPSSHCQGYQTSWDLSGRFFPYMGQFLPPMSSKDERWLNDPEGTQARANVSYSSIDHYYERAEANGFSTLSYFNVFEYGINIVFNKSTGPLPPSSQPLNEKNWMNASQYLDDNFRPALLTNFSRMDKRFARVIGAQTSWQGSVVVDPQPGMGYQKSLLSQVKRKMNQLEHFQGIVVDRSDWNQLVNFDADDGKTWVIDYPGWSFQYSGLDILNKVRKILDSDTGSDTGADAGATSGATSGKVMLSNTVGYSWLPMMEPFDGTYSEGNRVNAVGILGCVSTAILWTSSSHELGLTNTTADAFFQTRLRLGVFPQAPFPDNDHCIAPSTFADRQYLRYGSLMNAMKGADWILDPNPVTVSPAQAQTNAFTVPARASVKGHLLFPIMLAGSDVTEAQVQIRLSDRHFPKGKLAFSVLHPGSGAVWKHVATMTARSGPQGQGGSMNGTLLLVSGCAMMKVEAA